MTADAGPHATPDQARAAEKRAAAARAAAGQASTAEARTTPPKGRRSADASETA